jgi:hypothetical protein
MDLKDIENSDVKIEVKTSDNREMSLLLAVGVVFLPFIFSWVTLKKGYSVKARSISFLWLAFLIFTLNRGDKVDKTVAVASVQQEKKGATPIAESCLKVAGMFGSSSPLSDLQKDELWKQYEGRLFIWKLVVSEVAAETFGKGFTVQFKCIGSDSFISDVMMGYPESSKAEVLSLVKGRSYKIGGRLERFSGLIGLTAVPE